MTAPQAQSFRDRIDANPAAFAQIVRDLAAFRPDFRLYGEEYKRKKGDAGELLNPWYNRKSISVGYTFGYDAPVTAALLLAYYDALTPLFRWLRLSNG